MYYFLGSHHPLHLVLPIYPCRRHHLPLPQSEYAELDRFKPFGRGRCDTSARSPWGCFACRCRLAGLRSWQGALPRRYNPTVMARWFIAIFTLHFFLGVGFFAFGHKLDQGLLQHHAAAVQALAVDPLQTSDASRDPETFNLTSEHALNDAQPDWPDVLLRPPAGPRLNQLSSTPERHVLAALLAPPLEGPQRPPRGAGSAA